MRAKNGLLISFSTSLGTWLISMADSAWKGNNVRKQTLDAERLILFSDGMFAVILTVMVRRMVFTNIYLVVHV